MSTEIARPPGAKAVKCAGPAHLDLKICRARELFSKLRDSDRENALRGLFLGGLFWQIKHDTPRGGYERLADERMPEIPKRTRCEIMRIWNIFLKKSGVAVPADMAIAETQLALALRDEGPAREITTAAVKFIGDLSLHALMAKWGVRDKTLLGGARSRGDREPLDIDPERLHAHAREEISAAVESLRHLLLIENICVRLTPEEVRAIDVSLDVMLTTWRRGLGKLLKAKA